MHSHDEKMKLEKDLSDPGSLPEEAIQQAVALMRTGRLHRYGEYGDTEPHAALFEMEFAEYIGSRFAVGVNSGGCAIFLALKVAGVGPGVPVLVNAFNLAPVPGAIEHAGGEAVLVEITDEFTIDLNDLREKALSSGARILLLTHMRGHITDMDALMQICNELGIKVIEDCAHTMGASWKDKFTGRFGELGCFSTQTFKHINSGEGGILVTDNEDFAAQAVLYSGSYMLYGQHKAAPSQQVFDKWKGKIPNFSMRMSNLVAAVLRPQLREMAERGRQWNNNYRLLESRLNAINGVEVPARIADEAFVASSIQFFVQGLDAAQMQQFADRVTAKGVAVKWFGRDEPMGYTSLYQHWGYLKKQHLPDTDQILSTTCDMRIPLDLTEAHCDRIAEVIAQELSQIT